MRFLKITAAPLAILLLTFTGCGGKGGSSADAPPSDPPSQAAPSNDPAVPAAPPSDPAVPAVPAAPPGNPPAPPGNPPAQPGDPAAPPSNPPDLALTIQHTGNFTQGQTGATYTITVANIGSGSTTGTVTVTDTSPGTGLTPTALSGQGWNCTLGTLSCTRSDALAATASFPAITLAVKVADNAPAGVTNSATVSGGGDASPGNNSAYDATVIEVSRPLPVYPLKASARGRYLVDQNNVPFLITGDAPQSLIVNLSAADAEVFFANRKALGFNANWINLLCATQSGGRADASTYDGIVPFTTPGDLATPNEAYFSRADDMIRLAAKYGITVFLDPIETKAWLDVLRLNGLVKARAYGRYLGTRYKNFDNIVWMSGDEFQTWSDATDDALMQAVALGIGDTDTRHIQTVILDHDLSSSLDDSTWEPIIRLDAVLTYYPTYAEVLKEYNRANSMPIFVAEANYEFENSTSRDFGSPALLRHQEYWAMLSGASGQLYGSRYTWQFPVGWQSQIQTPGAIQLGYLKALFEPLRWYDLVPDQSHTFITAGYGTFSSVATITFNDYATAAITADGAHGLAYLPTRRTVTVNMAKLANQATAQWYDPGNGRYTTIAGSPFANVGTREFTPPGNNSVGDADWVLVFTAP